jgi:hypothetical protein
MTYPALITLVKTFYPDPEPFERCLAGDFETEGHLCGDTLIYAIVSNLAANFDATQSDPEQIEAASDVLQLLIEDLQDLRYGLQYILQNS